MLAFADIDTDEDVDGVMLLVLLHRSMCGMNELACNLGGESRHPRYGRPRICLGRAPISDHQPPTRPGDNTPRIMSDWGRESCRAWLAKAPIIGA
ncbi:hypothetical protein DO72_3041 [Burkholderia pseudomallei]|nr:hypothetical protein DO72_3041 [Burkholderia pseudomallei]